MTDGNTNLDHLRYFNRDQAVRARAGDDVSRQVTSFIENCLETGRAEDVPDLVRMEADRCAQQHQAQVAPRPKFGGVGDWTPSGRWHWPLCYDRALSEAWGSVADRIRKVKEDLDVFGEVQE